jgi:hypothetical protein
MSVSVIAVVARAPVVAIRGFVVAAGLVVVAAVVVTVAVAAGFSFRFGIFAGLFLGREGLLEFVEAVVHGWMWWWGRGLGAVAFGWE